MDNSFRKMRFSGIYEIRNLSNNKRYIGSSYNIHKRWLQHRWDLENKKHHSRHLQLSWDRYGSDNFQIFVLEKTGIENLETRERYYVEFYESTNGEFGYNETSGGKGCPDRKVAIETREKISNSNKGKRHSEISKTRISEAGIGRKHTKETKEKMSSSRRGKPIFALRGRPCPEHVKEIVRKTHLGKKRNPEVGDKISLSKIGIKTNRKTSSKYVGVSRVGDNKWKAYISVNKKRINLGNHNTEVGAAIAYNEAALKYFGKNANLNIIQED